MQMFMEALFIIAKNWKQLKCLLTSKQVNELFHNHAMEQCSAIKMKEHDNMDESQKHYTE